MGITKEVFGKSKDPLSGVETEVFRYTLKTSKGVIVKVLSLGATISSVEVPDKNNITDHVVLGFDSVADYEKHSHMGSTIGRFANRIKDGKFKLNGKEYQLAKNNNGNHLHGGIIGWEKYNWKSHVEGNKITFTHSSQDGDEGYPGDVMCQVTYSLGEDGGLRVDYQAISSQPTPINITNHAFFNLAGHAKGQKGLYEHEIQVLGDSYLPSTDLLIPTGEIKSVKNTPFDLRNKVKLDEAMSKTPQGGFDTCYCFTTKTRGDLELAAVVVHPNSGRKLEVFTTEIGIQAYTGGAMPKDPSTMVGRGKTPYLHQGAFCLEPQDYPDAVNKANFPSCILQPGHVYKHTLVYKFTTS